MGMINLKFLPVVLHSLEVNSCFHNYVFLSTLRGFVMNRTVSLIYWLGSITGAAARRGAPRRSGTVLGCGF